MTRHFEVGTEQMGPRRKLAKAECMFWGAAATLFFLGAVAGGCGTEPPKPKAEAAAEAKPAEPAIPEDIQAAAKQLLGSDAQVLLFGDQAKTCNQQFLAANVVPKTPKNNIPGTVVTRAVVAEEDGGKFTELLRCDVHWKNPKGFLGATPLDSITGWRLQYDIVRLSIVDAE